MSREPRTRRIFRQRPVHFNPQIIVHPLGMPSLPVLIPRRVERLRWFTRRILVVREIRLTASEMWVLGLRSIPLAMLILSARQDRLIFRRHQAPSFRPPLLRL